MVGHWSLAGGFSCRVPGLLMTGDYFVGKLSAVGQPTQPSSHPAVEISKTAD